VSLLKISLTLVLSLCFMARVDSSNASTNAGQSLSVQNASGAHAPVSFSAQRGSRAGSLRFARQLIKEKNRRRKYTVDASYPQLVGSKAANASQFNLAVKNLFTGALNEFKKNVQPSDASVPAEVQLNTFYAGYSIEYGGPDLISVAFQFDAYYAGAIHPQPYSMTLNYDLKAGRALSLSDLFKPRSNYLQVISGYAIKTLTKKLGDNSDHESVEHGAAPSSENFKSWSLTRRGLSITFDPYQVAAYAFGPQVVVIPYASLRSVIDMDGPIGSLASQSPARKSPKSKA
jgi:hypothetical protein